VFSGHDEAEGVSTRAFAKQMAALSGETPTRQPIAERQPPSAGCAGLTLAIRHSVTLSR